MTTRKKRFTVLASESDIAYLDYVAEELNISRGKLIRIAIENHVHKLKHIYGKPPHNAKEETAHP